jgi:hypothetical protein
MADPTKYRQEAEFLRKEADETTGDPDHQRMLRQLAALYDRLAGHLGKRWEDAE